MASARPTTSKIATGLGFALYNDVAERRKIVSALQLPARRLADDNPGAVLLVQRLEPRAEVHGIPDDRIAHDRFGADVAGNHRPGIDADADVQLGTSFRFPALH